MIKAFDENEIYTITIAELDKFLTHGLYQKMLYRIKPTMKFQIIPNDELRWSIERMELHHYVHIIAHDWDNAKLETEKVWVPFGDSIFDKPLTAEKHLKEWKNRLKKVDAHMALPPHYVYLDEA